MVKFINALKEAKTPLLSIEITPPDRGKSVDEIFRTIDNLMPYNPRFINVTFHQPHVVYEEIGETIIRRPKRKKPGTVGISASIQNRYNVDVIPHLICGGFNKYETEDALIDLHFLGIENILALRGDPAPGYINFVPEKDGYQYASDLVLQIKDMNNGIYIDQLENPVPTSFCIGVAGYPEKHCEAPNLERDLINLKRKVDNGADYIITQMFFSFSQYKVFVQEARKIGITVPIIPGIKPLTSARQLSLIPKLFHATLPDELVNGILDAKTTKDAFNNGVNFTVKLLQQLLDFNAPGLHIFTMDSGKSANKVLHRVFGSWF